LVQSPAQAEAPKLVAVALANKIARIPWKLMMSGETYAKREQTA
jgi:transposase